MIVEEERLYYASLINDIDFLEADLKKREKSSLDNSDFSDTIRLQISLQSDTKRMLWEDFLNTGVPVSLVDGQIVTVVNGKTLMISESEIHEFNLLNISDEPATWNLDNFPLRTKAFLNDGGIIEAPKLPVEEAVQFNTEKDERTDFVHTDQLLMNAYQISYPDGEKEKVMTIITAPLKSPKDNVLSVPIFAMAKKDGKIITVASNPETRASLILNVGGESVTLKGTWARNKFKTFIYPQKTQGRDIKITKKEYSPSKLCANIGHYIHQDDETELHILPMSTKNNSSGYVQFIVCKRSLEDSGYVNEVDLSSNGKDMIFGNYVISVKWEEDKLIVDVRKQM